MTMTYSIANEFSTTPGGRFRKHGPYSGQEFRDDVLRDLLQTAIEDSDTLSIVLGRNLRIPFVVLGGSVRGADSFGLCLTEPQYGST